MNLAPDTTTIEAQRNTELLLLDYLRSTNPHTYALWCDHPDHNRSSDDDDDGEDASDGDARLESRSEGTNTRHSSNKASDASSSSSACSADKPSAKRAGEAEAAFAYHEAQFHRAAHVTYASAYLQDLPTALQGMYPARPWVAYWCLQAADLLGVLESDLLARTPAADITAFLHSCLSHDKTCEAELRAADQAGAAAAAAAFNSENASEDIQSTLADAADGVSRPVVGFAGGPVHQWPHLAASYAACCALAVLAAHTNGASLRQLPRAAIKRWLLALRNDDGSFRVHGGGESDIRASYCAAVITALLSLDDPTTFDAQRRAYAGEASEDGAPREYVDDVQYEPVLTWQTAKFVAACQTHEGGFTCSATASEAHGAYTQCGLAALLLMKQPHLVHQASLRRWLAARQLNCEGGFNGRTNKLVDSCYSHWIGASHVLLRTVEAYTKCFTPLAGKSEEGEAREKEDMTEASASAYLVAKDVVLLDHAQLLDAKLIQTTETAAWDAAEVAAFKRADLADQFLNADDSCLREASAKQAATSALFDDIYRSREQAVSGEKDKTRVEESVRAFHKRQAFLYADVGDFYFNQRKLQDYVLRCCQDAEIGGLMDKPGTAHDAYHTCYSMSGMSAAQNLQYLTHAAAAAATAATPQTPPTDSSSSMPYLNRAFAQSYLPKRSTAGSYGVVLSIPGPTPAAEAAVLRTTSPIFNIHQSGVLGALRVWGLKTFL